MDLKEYNKADYTPWTPDLNVGIDKYILGDDKLDSQHIYSGVDLLIRDVLKGEEREKWLGDLSKPRFKNTLNFSWRDNIHDFSHYSKHYNQDVFSKPIRLDYQVYDCLVGIYCYIRGCHKKMFEEELINKYGQNRNWEYKIKGIYRTEISNLLGTINIHFGYDSERDVAILNMYFIYLERTKRELGKKQLEMKKKSEEERAKQERIKAEEEHKRRVEEERIKNIKGLFDIE